MIKQRGEGGLGAFIAILSVVLLTWLFYYMIASTSEAGAAFMKECLTERKQYECTAMWRAGDSSTTVMPIVIPMGR